MRALSLGLVRFIVPLLVKVIINACLLFMMTGLPVGLTCSITIHLKITNRDTNGMPKFLDVHSLKGLDEEALRKTQNSPKDEFGVTHDNILYNKEEDKFFCLLDAPSKEAVAKHHEKHGFKCDWITEVKTTTP